MSTPRIGITIGRMDRDGRRFHATPVEYVAAIVEAGGIPLILPPLPVGLAAETGKHLDGLLLTGGGDVAPARYGASRDMETTDVDDDRDASELALVAVAVNRHLPILGICRGAQLLNVAFGGSLHQHLSADRGVEHRDSTRRFEAVHDVELEPSSLLPTLAGSSRLKVNSIHHQGINRVEPPLRAVGFAEDGVVEVLESEELSVLGVQWHPECLPAQPVNRALFSWLIAKASAASPDEA